MTELVSAVPSRELRAPFRVDPYWSGLWAPGSTASWVSASQSEALVASGLARMPAHLSRGSKNDLGWMDKRSARNLRLDSLAVLDSWRTVTCEQLAAFTGAPELLTGRSTAMSELFQNRLVDAGVYSRPLWDSRHTPRGTLYRPSRGTAFDQRVAPQLSWAEWVSVTGGHPFESGGQFDRHNVLTTELALRVAEYCEIGTVIGEKLSSIDLLAHSGLGHQTISQSQRAADATFIRTDGMRIAVEMTATAGKTFREKVRRWAELLQNRRLNQSGLVVVFVVADRQDSDRVHNKDEISRVRSAVAAACRDFPGIPFDRTANRMFVADWADWFPRAGYIDDSFLGLNAWRPSGTIDDIWREAMVLDVLDVPFDPTDQDDMMGVIDNAALLRSIPYWMGGGKPEELWPMVVSSSGLDPHLTKIAGYTSGFSGTRKGAVNPTLMPERIRVRRRT